MDGNQNKKKRTQRIKYKSHHQSNTIVPAFGQQPVYFYLQNRL
jgi:ethanolamine utilization protein EutP (predicted NTPase)